MTRDILKFSIGGLVIVAAGAAALYGVQYLRLRNDPVYQEMKRGREIMAEWERQYREDTYGGITPQETLNLFIDALKKGDTNLAARYFVPDEYEKWRNELNEFSHTGSFDEMIRELQQTKMTVTGNTAFFTLVRQNDLPSELVMHKNLQTGVWKITEL